MSKRGRKSKYRFDEVLVNVGDKDYHLYENAPQIRQAVTYWAKSRNKKVVTHFRVADGVKLLEIELVA